MFGYPTDGGKILKLRLLVLTEFTNVTDGRTDGQTPHDSIGRSCIQHRAAIKSSRRYHVDSSFDYKVTFAIVIIVKIEVSSRQPLGTPIFKPCKRSKSEENDPPPVIRRLATVPAGV